MKLLKPSLGLIAEFKAVVAELSPAQPRKMFGYDAAFVNGNMAAGLWQDTCVLKLTQDHQQELLRSGNARPFSPLKGRAMTGWVELSAQLAHDPEELLKWCRRAVDYVATLPPKSPKASSKRARQGEKTSAKRPRKRSHPSRA